MKFKKIILKPLGIIIFTAFIICVYVFGFAIFAGSFYLLIKGEKGIHKSHLLNETKIQKYNEKNNGPMFKSYMSELQKRIKKNWHPIRGYKSKRVVVLFKISKEGRLLKLNINKSSGVSNVDDAALEAIRKSAPFDPLPHEYQEKDVDIQFTFDYNVFNKNE